METHQLVRATGIIQVHQVAERQQAAEFLSGGKELDRVLEAAVRPHDSILYHSCHASLVFFASTAL
jgi:hypothetical protein